MSVDRKLHVAILKGFFRAVLKVQLPDGRSVADLVREVDESLYVCVGNEVGDIAGFEAVRKKYEDIRDRHGKTLDKLGDAERLDDAVADYLEKKTDQGADIRASLMLYVDNLMGQAFRAGAIWAIYKDASPKAPATPGSTEEQQDRRDADEAAERGG